MLTTATHLQWLQRTTEGQATLRLEAAKLMHHLPLCVVTWPDNWVQVLTAPRHRVCEVRMPAEARDATGELAMALDEYLLTMQTKRFGEDSWLLDVAWEGRAEEMTAAEKAQWIVTGQLVRELRRCRK